MSPDDLPRIMSFTEQILHHPIEIIAGVEETLEYLFRTPRLTLFTKGDPEEQKLKVDRSGLGDIFRPYRDREGEGRGVLIRL